jgi:hypothetical protein
MQVHGWLYYLMKGFWIPALTVAAIVGWVQSIRAKRRKP